MKIIINIDGVLIDKTSFQYQNGLKYFKNNLMFVNEHAYLFRDMFNCSKEENEDFWKKNRLKYYLFAKPEEGATEYLHKLKEEGHTIYLLASRKYLTDDTLKGDMYRKLLSNWLKRNNIPYDFICYCNESNHVEEKLKLVHKEKIDLIFEDSISDAINLSKISHVIMYNRPYNFGFTSVKRINNFKELKKIKNKVKEK